MKFILKEKEELSAGSPGTRIFVILMECKQISVLSSCPPYFCSSFSRCALPWYTAKKYCCKVCKSFIIMVKVNLSNKLTGGHI